MYKKILNLSPLLLALLLVACGSSSDRDMMGSRIMLWHGMSLHLYLLTFLLMSLLTACGGSPMSDVPPPTIEPLIAQGKNVFSKHCASCHAIVPETIILGPSLADIATRAASRMDGFDARQYIESSISNPSLYLVEGYPDAMPSNLAKKMTGEELDAVVAYLLTLH